MTKDASKNEYSLNALENGSVSYVSFREAELSHAEIGRIARALKRPTKGGVKAVNMTRCAITKNSIDAEGMRLLAPAFLRNTQLTEADFSGNDLGDDGVASLIAGLEKCHALEKLDLTHNSIGDEGAEALAEFITRMPNLTSIKLRGNKITDRGAEVLAGVLRVRPNITTLFLGDCPFIGTAGKTALAQTIVECNHKNIVSIFASGTPDTEPVMKHTNNNRAKRALITTQIALFKEDEPGDPKIWLNFIERQPSVQESSDVSFQMQKFERFLDRLPKVELAEIASAEDFVAALMTKPEGSDYAPIDNPRTLLELGSTLADLNAQGVQLHYETLFQDNGEPSPFLECIMDRDQTPVLFTYANWAGTPKSVMNRALNALPEDAQKTIPNRQQLMIALERDERIAAMAR